MTQALAKAPSVDADELGEPVVDVAAPLDLAPRAAADPAATPAALFWRDARRSVFVAGYKLLAEYMTFAAGVGFALFLYSSRVPMRLVDRALGLRLRERFIDLIARISPG